MSNTKSAAVKQIESDIQQMIDDEGNLLTINESQVTTDELRSLLIQYKGELTELELELDSCPNITAIPAEMKDNITTLFTVKKATWTNHHTSRYPQILK